MDQALSPGLCDLCVGNMEESGKNGKHGKRSPGAGSMGYGPVEFANDTCNEMGITSHGLYLKNGKQCERKKLKHMGGVDQTHFLSVKPWDKNQNSTTQQSPESHHLNRQPTRCHIQRSEELHSVQSRPCPGRCRSGVC